MTLYLEENGQMVQGRKFVRKKGKFVQGCEYAQVAKQHLSHSTISHSRLTQPEKARFDVSRLTKLVEQRDRDSSCR